MSALKSKGNRQQRNTFINDVVSHASFNDVKSECYLVWCKLCQLICAFQSLSVYVLCLLVDWKCHFENGIFILVKIVFS